MTQAAQILFDYLRDILFDPEGAKLDIESIDEDLQALGKGLMYLSSSLNEVRRFAHALSRGDLDIGHLPNGNEIAAPLKAMHANLRHLTWQSQQVAKGDYSQRVDFMGDFSEAFNSMTQLLEQREKALEEEIRISHEKTEAVEKNIAFLTEITLNMPQLIFVLEEESDELLFANKAAKCVLDEEPDFIRILTNHRMAGRRGANGEIVFSCGEGETERYYSASQYRIFWNDKNAAAYAVNDISQEQMRRKELEEYAFRDPLTKLFNRLYGMRVLHEWLAEGKHFVLCFADLDNLKYINDNIGHAEGDEYILRAADAMSRFSDSAICARIGGDEFLILIPDRTEDEASARMEEVRDAIRHQLKAEGKPYYSNISYGMVEVAMGGTMTAGDVMSLADERMYKNKWANKQRKQEGREGAEDASAPRPSLV